MRAWFWGIPAAAARSWVPGSTPEGVRKHAPKRLLQRHASALAIGRCRLRLPGSPRERWDIASPARRDRRCRRDHRDSHDLRDCALRQPGPERARVPPASLVSQPTWCRRTGPELLALITNPAQSDRVITAGLSPGRLVRQSRRLSHRASGTRTPSVHGRLSAQGAVTTRAGTGRRSHPNCERSAASTPRRKTPGKHSWSTSECSDDRVPEDRWR